MAIDKALLKKLIDTAAGTEEADLVIKNCRIIDVYNGCITKPKDIAITGGYIAGTGSYKSKTEIDAQGKFAAPGLIDAHIHIESSYVTPEEFGRLVVPHGTTTIIADPHEIVNVCGVEGLDYMIGAADATKLDIKFMLPSCVPATPFENAGATISAEDMKAPITYDDILGLGEFMDFNGVINAEEKVLDKIMVAIEAGKIIDGHSPALMGKGLNAYAAAGIRTDHECSTVEEMQDRIARGLYIQMREGSACHDLRNLIKGVTAANSRRCLLCSDDRQPKTVFEEGHIDSLLRICVEEGIDAITAIQMASLNAAECYRLEDRGAIVPGRRADIILFDSLREFNVSHTFIKGEEAARDGRYLFDTVRCDSTPLNGRFYLKDFNIKKLKLHLKSDFVNIIDLVEGGVLTEKTVARIKMDTEGDFVYQPGTDIVKVAVIERHRNTGNVGLGLMRGYGIKAGAVALSVAHDSHNIIVTGTNNEDMAMAVSSLAELGGGIILVRDGRIINHMPLVVGGIMSDQSGEWVIERLDEIHRYAHDELGISSAVDPFMTLCFMALAVIPEIKLTDRGLFAVANFEFMELEAGITQNNN